MKIQVIFIVTLGIILCREAKAQEVTFKTEYIGNSGYWYKANDNTPKEKIGDSKGSAIVYQGSVNIPLSQKMDENNRPTAWGIGLSGAYASLNNKNFTDQMVSDIVTVQLGVYHIRPLNNKWSIRASMGIGIYAPYTDISKIGFRNVLGSVGVVFIRHLKPNLDIGGGVALNSALGYPMLFPAFFLNWSRDGYFNVNVELQEGLDISVGHKFNENIKLSLALEMNGQMALTEKDGKDKIFTHQYLVTGLRPEINLGKKGLSMTFMAGISAYRPATYSDRSLKGIFATNNDYFFSVSPYASAGISFKL